ncbi:amino acid ABC transporter permease [Labrys monachus]|uniref:Polar amino acid transport system permease protein n=1 Tax=Labrys monachus TaxID=217067 RepID=A0ABU0FGZ9_9HYPH|nr:amino acid ABC transporter permease [Labrys monachus]MDQ0393889.1 polar amino acid transport system permease protein [Labrys monachus]
MSYLQALPGRAVDWWLSVADYIPDMLHSCLVVVEITLVVILLSWICGLAAALGKMSPLAVLRWPSQFYIWFIRGTPTLIQIFIVYFGIPQFGVRMSPFVAGSLALGIGSGAYVAEIIRSGLLAIPKGQMESTTAIGMSRRQSLQHIILPQVVRIIVPALTNEAVSTLKNTSLLSVITIIELTLQSQIIISATFRPFDFYIIAAFMYLFMTTALMAAAGWFERHLALRY